MFEMKQESVGAEIHRFASLLWPLNRSLTGDGVRETLRRIKEHLPDLSIHEVKSGIQVFDWVVPKEWRVREAWISTPAGEKICDFSRNNLHLVGYSIPVHKSLSLADLQAHLYSLPGQPDAIPYITSYYEERWGFCISENQRRTLLEGEYEVLIDSDLFDGALTYGELVIPGASGREIFISTYVCHPSMANNELSGPSVTTFIAKWIQCLPSRRYTYRIIFIPETIGSITYLSRNLVHLQRHVIAGFNVTCIGDDRDYSYLPTRKGNTLSDRVAQHVLRSIDKDFVRYGWHDRGSDERQYCAPLVDLPVASIMRTKYGNYDEYHTSLDDLISVVTPSGLEGGYRALQLALEALEKNMKPKVKVCCEPQLGRRGLYPTLSTKQSSKEVRVMMDLITWSDGERTLLDIAELIGVPIWETYPIVEKLVANDLLELIDPE